MADDEGGQISLAALLRLARNSLASVIRSALAAAGYGDLPANGPYVLCAASVEGTPLAAIIGQLRLSKQASGHLVDLLVLRGYLDRHIDPADRRKHLLSPTAKGSAAARIVRDAVDGLEARLKSSVGIADLDVTRRTLTCLAAMATHGA